MDKDGGNGKERLKGWNEVRNIIDKLEPSERAALKTEVRTNLMNMSALEVHERFLLAGQHPQDKLDFTMITVDWILTKMTERGY